MNARISNPAAARRPVFVEALPMGDTGWSLERALPRLDFRPATL